MLKLNQLSGFGGNKPPVYTLRGYGSRTSGDDTGPLVLSYGTVISGAAPQAGDLVIWSIVTFDSAPVDPSSTPTGWSGTTASLIELFFRGLAKIVNSGDLASPPTAVTNPDGGAGGLWIAYSIEGFSNAPTAAGAQLTYDAVSAPTNLAFNLSALRGPLVAATTAMGTDGSISLTWTGGTESSSSGTAADLVWPLAGRDLAGKWKIYQLNTTGENITVSKGDDGEYNMLASFYVTL